MAERLLRDYTVFTNCLQDPDILYMRDSVRAATPGGAKMALYRRYRQHEEDMGRKVLSFRDWLIEAEPTARLSMYCE